MTNIDLKNDIPPIDFKKVLDDGQVAIVCGAGISYNSGVPLVLPLIKAILRAIKVDEADIATYIKRTPFEAFLETLNFNLKIDELLKVFNVVNPNSNHFLIASLIKKGAVNTVYTTNFDTNIEVALIQLGMREGKDFVVARDPANFDLGSVGNLPLIAKLHGSGDSSAPLGATLARIANKSNELVLRPYIEHLLNAKRHSSIIFLGYSFSDKFDIQPLFQNLVGNYSGLIVNVDHTQEEGSWGKKEFNTWSILQLQINTDQWTVDRLADLDITKHWPAVKDVPHWAKQVKAWKNARLDGIGVRNEYATAASLFGGIGRKDLATKYTLRGIGKINLRDAYGAMALYQDKAGQLADHKNDHKTLQSAEEACKQALKFASMVDASIREHCIARIRERLGSIYGIIFYKYKFEKNAAKAMEYFKMAEPLLKNAVTFSQKTLFVKKDRASVEMHYGYTLNLALLYRRTDDPKAVKQAIEIYDQLLVDVAPLGEARVKQIECALYYNKAYAHEFLGELDISLDYYIKSFELSKLLGIIDRVYYAFIEIIPSLNRLKGTDIAHEFYLNNYKDVIAPDTGLSLQIHQFKELSEK